MSGSAATPGSDGVPHVRNILTVDVEDYFMVTAFADAVPEAEWPVRESRVVRNTGRVLDLLDRHGARGTFFVLGWVAERFPGIVREIDRRGHEVACHSHRHRLVYRMTEEAFRDDTRTARGILEDVVGKPILGYRAPSYSITAKTPWALDILAEEGFRYDSSIFPIRHDLYGFPGFPRFPVLLERREGRVILEIPLSTVRILGATLPVAGGGYLRLYPYRVTEWAIRRINREEGRPAVVYFHPWEVDPDQPKLAGRLLSRARHYVNLAATQHRVASLLETFRFGPVRDVALNNEAVRPAPAAGEARCASW